MTTARAWQEVADWSATLLRRQTGTGVVEWNRRVLGCGEGTEVGVRRWLRERGVLGYPQLLLVMERFGRPEPLGGVASGVLAAQYSGRPELRPVLERLVAESGTFGAQHVQVRRTHVALVTPRRTYAVLRPVGRDRVDLGLRLVGQEPVGRLAAVAVSGNASLTVRIVVTSADEVDGETVDWLRRAYSENC
ncbi:DUF5655 domain-containing protein [Actinosynnema pretiosum]|uniref:DUF5655 domain-containing protein n=1 Tax=Actinosynnema pretiosum TaxID=42197 RepID=A0A290Z400_9PSEU|nr:DUF5655 domain-containing protein [Actinosynnema pretiosum]ATE53750.1 hypothetical protein CNX65_10965 [Actinosynnema pretiosum]